MNPRARQATAKRIFDLNASALVIMASGDIIRVFTDVAKKYGIPILVSERAHPPSARQIYWSKHLQNEYFDTYDSADVVAVQLPSFKNDFPARMHEKIVVLPNPIKPPLNPGKYKRKKIILCVARIYLAQKRQDLLVNSFALLAKKHPGWQIHLYGTERSNDGDVLREIIQKNGLEERIIFMGSTENLDLAYGTASIFAFPSMFEGFPNALAEALSFGVPAIGFKECPGTNEIIIDGFNGVLVDEGNDELVVAFSKALDRLMASPKIRKEFGKNALEVIKKYELGTALGKWNESIKSLVKLKRSNSPATDLYPGSSFIKLMVGKAVSSSFSLLMKPSAKRSKVIQNPFGFFEDSQYSFLRVFRHLYKEF